jgi:hypothetical protein
VLVHRTGGKEHEMEIIKQVLKPAGQAAQK